MKSIRLLLAVAVLSFAGSFGASAAPPDPCVKTNAHFLPPDPCAKGQPVLSIVLEMLLGLPLL